MNAPEKAIIHFRGPGVDMIAVLDIHKKDKEEHCKDRYKQKYFKSPCELNLEEDPSESLHVPPLGGFWNRSLRR